MVLRIILVNFKDNFGLIDNLGFKEIRCFKDIFCFNDNLIIKNQIFLILNPKKKIVRY